MKALGDPTRVVGAYVTDVEISEEQQLAASDAKAQESATTISPDEPASAVLPDNPIETATGPADMFRATEGRWGSREIEIVDVSLTGPDGERAHVFHSGEPLDVRLRLRAPLAIEDFVVGIGIFNAEGVCCYGTNTDIEELKAERIFGDAEAVFSIESLDLVEGTYKLDVAIHKADGYPYDYHRLLHTFRVKSRTKDVGIYRPRHAWQFSEGDDVHAPHQACHARHSSEAMKVEGAGESRVLSREQAVELVAAFREAKKTVVFTNGVFDLLHPGHVRYLDGGAVTRRRADSGTQRGRVRAPEQGPGAADYARTGAGRGAGRVVVGRRGRDLRRTTRRPRSSKPFSRTSSSRAQTGRPTRSSGATPSKRAAAASCSSRSSRGIRRHRSSSGCDGPAFAEAAAVPRAKAELRPVLDRGFDLRDDRRRNDRHVVLFPRVRLGFCEDLVGVLADNHRVAARHQIAALQHFRHATPPFELSDVGADSHA